MRLLVEDLERLVVGKEKLVQIKYPREVHFVKNGIQHLAKGNTRKGGATYVLKACLEHVRVVLILTKG